jgi:hypothetical protein
LSGGDAFPGGRAKFASTRSCRIPDGGASSSSNAFAKPGADMANLFFNALFLKLQTLEGRIQQGMIVDRTNSRHLVSCTG